MTKKNPEDLRENKILHQAKTEIPGFEDLIYRFERNLSFRQQNI